VIEFGSDLRDPLELEIRLSAELVKGDFDLVNLRMRRGRRYSVASDGEVPSAPSKLTSPDSFISLRRRCIFATVRSMA
jgi:hypothetical protein